MPSLFNELTLTLGVESRELKYLNLCSQLNLSELSEAEDAAEVFLIFCALEE